jgi:hypothetical protein
MSRQVLRHLETRVQHEFVLVDEETGEFIRKVVDPPCTVSAADWPAYSSERFPKSLAETQERLDKEAKAKED